MISAMINLLKLCVGAATVEDLFDWQRQQRPHWPEGKAIHVTRMWPRREADVLEGSLYWVIKGKINRDIGDILGSSPATVKKQLESVFAKMGVETRTAAAGLALSRVAQLKAR